MLDIFGIKGIGGHPCDVNRYHHAYIGCRRLGTFDSSRMGQSDGFTSRGVLLVASGFGICICYLDIMSCTPLHYMLCTFADYDAL